MGCSVTQFDVAEMIAPTSLWELPVGWRQLTSQQQGLPEQTADLANTHTIFISDRTFAGFAPTVVASAFQIEGDIDITNMFADLGDQLPESALNEHIESDILIREPEYVSAQVRSLFTAATNGKMIDFESVTRYDLYLIPLGAHILLQRTVITPNDDPAVKPLFSDARPPQ